MSRRTKFAKLALGSTSTPANSRSKRQIPATTTYISKFFTNNLPDVVEPTANSQVPEPEAEPAIKRIRINGKEIVEQPIENDSDAADGLVAVRVLTPEAKKPAKTSSEKDLKAIYSKTSDKISQLPAADASNTENAVHKFFKDKNDTDDFQPKRIRVLPTILQAETKTKATKKVRAPRGTTKGDRKKQSDIRKMINKNYNDEQIFEEMVAAESAAEQICPYELQMAIALSKSILETEGDASNEPDDASLLSGKTTGDGSVESTEERVNGLRHTLESYGFKCKNSYDDHNLQTLLGIGGKKSKRWNKIPTLLLRRNTSRQAQIIAERVQLVLQTAFEADENTDPNIGPCIVYRPHSKFLREFHIEDQFLFRISSNANERLNIYDYYVGSLVEVSSVKAGQLLKDWSKIPGREKSPDPRLGDSFVQNWNAEEVTVPHIPLHKSSIVELEQNFEYAPTPCTTVMDRSSPDLFTQASSTGGESPKYFTADDNDQILRRPSEDLSKSIDDLFEMSDEFDGADGGEVTPFASVPETEYNEEPKSQPDTNMEVAQTPESKDDDAQSSDGRSFRTYTISQCSRETSFSTPSACVSVPESSQGSPDREEITLRPLIPDEVSPTFTPTPDAISISDSDDHPAHSTLIPTTDLESRDLSPIPNEETSQLSDVLLISDDDTSNNSDELHVSDDEVNYSVGALVTPPRRSSKRPSFPPLSPSPSTEYTEPRKSLDETEIYFEPDSKDTSADDVLVISDDEAVPTDAYQRRFSLDQSIANIIDNAKQLLNMSTDRSPSPTPVQKTSRKSIALRKFRSDSFLLPESEHSLGRTPQAGIEELSEASDSEQPMVNQSFDEFDALVLGTRAEPGNAEPSFIDYCNDDVEFENSPAAAPTQDSTLPRSVNVLVQKPKPKSFSERFEHLNINVPGHNDVFLIQTENTINKPDYEQMTEPQLLQELRNFGLKALKRKQAVKILNHIYHQTHPFMEIADNGNVTLDTTSIGVEPEPVVATDPMADLMSKYGLTQKATTSKTKKSVKSTQPVQESASEENIDALEMEFQTNCFGAEMEDEEYLLPAKPRKKLHWCPVPLHLAFHNMLLCRPKMGIAILNYEPLDLDAIYKHFKALGLRFETNDLITFLDKRCITFRTENSISSRTKKKVENTQTS